MKPGSLSDHAVMLQARLALISSLQRTPPDLGYLLVPGAGISAYFSPIKVTIYQ